MSDREQAGFRGPVKICVEESTLPNQAVMRTTTAYRPDGMLLETRRDHGNGSAWVTAREYDSDGRVTRIKPANSDDPTSEIVYAYDRAGRSVSITNTGKGDRTDFQYDGQGRKTSVQSFDPETLQRTRNCAYAGSAWDAAGCGHGIPLGGTITTTYDENDRPIEMQTRDAIGQIMSRIIRTYNAAGLLIEEKPILEDPAPMLLDRLLDQIPAERHGRPNEAQFQAFNKGLKALMTGRAQTGTWQTYDTQNRLRTVREINFVFEKTTEIVYNERGDRAEEHSTIVGNSVMPIGVPFSIKDDGTLTPSEPTAERSPSPFDPPQRSEVHYAYQYDDHGNWTKQTAKSGLDSDAPFGVRRRQLTYYELEPV
jgi:YD repeat-containing protein